MQFKSHLSRQIRGVFKFLIKSIIVGHDDQYREHQLDKLTIMFENLHIALHS